MSDLPALTGRQLIALLKKDGWTDCGRVTHGVSLQKRGADGRTRIAVVPDKSVVLGETLHRIISVKQSGIGRQGLLDMIKRHGI